MIAPMVNSTAEDRQPTVLRDRSMQCRSDVDCRCDDTLNESTNDRYHDDRHENSADREVSRESARVTLLGGRGNEQP